MYSFEFQIATQIDTVIMNQFLSENYIEAPIIDTHKLSHHKPYPRINRATRTVIIYNLYTNSIDNRERRIDCII